MKSNRLKGWLRIQLENIKLFFVKPDYGAKVFCIGYNKTGTTSLGKSLELLGYRNSSFNTRVWRKLYKDGKINQVLKYTAKFESFDDLPWLREDMIPLLDQTFPGSKFIYLERDEASWKKSLETWAHSVTGRTPDAEKGWEKYLKHQAFVLDYFKDRPAEDFLRLTIKDPQGFRKLGEFLGRPAPQDGFPHWNKSQKTSLN